MTAGPLPSCDDTIRRALAEDIGRGDLTTDAIIPADARASGTLVARGALRVAGIEVALATFRALDPGVDARRLTNDGCDAKPGDGLGRVTGRARALLSAERVALNFLGRLSGIATATREAVKAVAGTRARILSTRKTAPGLRALEAYAVRAGGGENHRLGLDDAVLIKDNHRALAGGVAEAVRRARASSPVGPPLVVEVDSLQELGEALAAGAATILLDNMPLPALREAVALCAGRAVLEASGGITAENVRDVALTGVDRISLGWLTHSAPAADVAFEIVT
jgi:nicotinate-nucleotide pyrophosphorylase (carboxylating)